jgi:hypothetical protein
MNSVYYYSYVEFVPSDCALDLRFWLAADLDPVDFRVPIQENPEQSLGGYARAKEKTDACCFYLQEFESPGEVVRAEIDGRRPFVRAVSGHSLLSVPVQVSRWLPLSTFRGSNEVFHRFSTDENQQNRRKGSAT